jgi:PAS domain S-box-containing protein
MTDESSKTTMDVTGRTHAEEAVHQSEGDFRTLVDKSLQGMLVFQNQKVVYANAAQAEITGYTVEELKSMAMEQLIAMLHPLDRESTVERALKQMAGDLSLPSVECRMFRKDGSVRWLQIFSNPIDYDGHPALFTATIDITERKQAEQALTESEAKLKEAQQLANIGYWEADPVADRIIWSEGTLRIFGLQSRDNIMNYGQLQEMIHPDDRPIQQRALSEALRGSRLYDVEYRIVRPDGDIRFVHVRDEIVYDESRKPIRLFGAVQDITERKQAEEQIRQHAAQMQVLAEMSRALAECGLDYRRVLDTIAQRTAELIGDLCTITLFTDDKQRAVPVAVHYRDPKAHTVIHDTLLHIWQGSMDHPHQQTLVSGKSIYIPKVNKKEFRALLEPEFRNLVDAFGVSSLVGVPLRVQGRVIGALRIVRGHNGSPYTRDDLVLLQDLADRAALTIQNARLFEEVQGAQRRLQTLSSQLLTAQEQERRSIARELHDEIGQVLTAVSTDLQAVQHSPNGATRASRLEESIALVDDALSRVRDLSLDLRPAMLDDLGLVAALEWYIERQAERAGFEPAFIVEPQEMRLEPNLETTVFRVAQIALTNVARHAHAKHVGVELHQHESGLELVVRDDGVGFDVSSALARAAQGDSMGLPSMQERVRLACGELEIKSTPGHGAEIHARFPVPCKQVIDDGSEFSG